MKKLLLLITIILITTQLFAQDKIYKLKGSVIIAKVIEIGTDEIKYKLFDNPEGPVYVVDKSTLNRIEFADGRVEKYKLSYKDPENYQGQLSKAIKINFLAPLLGYSQISFEKSISPLKSYELALGIIGAGKNRQVDRFYLNGYQPYKRSAFGAFTEAGYKFNKLPTFFNKGSRMTHIMQGNYVKPTVLLGFYSDHVLNTKNNIPVIEKRNNVFGGLLLNFGQQWVFGEKFLIDIYYGIGYAFDNVTKDFNNGFYSSDIYNHFVIQRTGAGTNLGFSGGLKVGLLIK